MKHIKEYYEVIENVSGWRVYHIPTDICPNEETATELVEDCDAFDYMVDDQLDDTSINSVELIVEE